MLNLRALWRWRWPIATLVLAAPIVAYAVMRSVTWIDQPFPGFFLMNNAVVPTVSAFDWPRDRNAVFHAEVIAADGRPITSSAKVYEYAASKPVGTAIDYRLRRGSVELRETIPTRLFGVRDFIVTYGVMLLFGGAWLAFGIAVGFLQPESAQARVFLFQALVAGLYPITGVFLYQADLEWLSRFYFLLECLFPATWIHLAVVFPVEHHLRGRLLAAPAVAYAVSLALLWMVLRGLSAEPADLRPLHLTYLYGGASFVLFLANLGVQYRNHVDAAVRSRIKAVLPGAMAAGAVAFFALTSNALSTRDFPVQLGLIFTPLFSAGVAYAIARHRLFDVDRVVRTSFVYFILTIAIVSGYALIVSITPRFMPGGGFRALRLVLFLALALALDPLRQLIQRVVDRAFYRTRLNYRKTIGQLSEAMTALLDSREIIDRVTTVLAEEMHLESASICLVGRDREPARLWTRGPDRALVEIVAPEPLSVLRERLESNIRHGETPRSLRASEFPELAATVAAELVVPIVFRDGVLGALILGDKRSGRTFDSDDVSLLRTLANQTAVAIHNARSYEALADLSRTLDARVNEQTVALRTSNQELRAAYAQLKDAQSQLLQAEKLASLGRLVAGVAHELNNPASFVHGGLANLSRYMERLMAMVEAHERHPPQDESDRSALARVRAETGLDYVLRETPALLRICAEGSERIKKIVDDLRVFARADRGDRAPTDVVEGIASSLRLLGHRITKQDVEVVSDFADVPMVDASAGQLNQVWMNLIGNALDALDGVGQPRLTIRVRELPNGAGAAGRVEVTVADNGVGIAADHLPQIFEPFFTTKPVGSGTGLGLAITYGAVRSHAGSIDVDSQPGRGTTFTVRLPISRATRRGGETAA